MTNKPTAAEQYARLKEQAFEDFLESSFSDTALKGVDLYEVKCPSGMVFKCRKPDVEFSKNIGKMPMALSSQMILSQQSAKTGEDPQAIAEREFEAMSAAEQRAAVEMAVRIVQYIAVEPRLLVGNVNGRTDAISIDALTVEDFNYIAKWSSGGDAGPGLKTFRRKRK